MDKARAKASYTVEPELLPVTQCRGRGRACGRQEGVDELREASGYKNRSQGKAHQVLRELCTY